MPALTWADFEEILGALGDREFTDPPFERFVETGTALGQTVIPLSAHFRELHTIEIKEEFYDASGLLASGAQRAIHFYHGPSEEVLPGILRRLGGPTVFFLDAHWAGVGTGRGEVDVPLLRELRALDSLFPHKALVVIDDLRLFADEGRIICEVDWSPISVAAVRGCLRPGRVAASLAVGDRYVFALRALAAERPTATAKALGLRCSRAAPAAAVHEDDGSAWAGGGPWREPWVSAPGAELDMDKLARLWEGGQECKDLARSISNRFPRVPVPFVPFRLPPVKRYGADAEGDDD